MNMKTLLLNTNSITSKKEGLLVLDVRRTRNERELHLFPSPIFLEANNLIKALIQHKYNFIEYYSTWCFSMLLFILESPSRPWSRVWHPKLAKNHWTKKLGVAKNITKNKQTTIEELHAKLWGSKCLKIYFQNEFLQITSIISEISYEWCKIK